MHPSIVAIRSKSMTGYAIQAIVPRSGVVREWWGLHLDEQTYLMMVERIESARSIANGALGEINAHGRECKLRDAAINQRLNKIEGGIDKVVYAAGAVVISLIAWLSVQVWDGRNAQAAPVAPASLAAR